MFNGPQGAATTNMLEKYQTPIIIVILLVGFFLRFSTAASIPPIYDEMDDLPSAEKISFDLNDLNLPLVDTRRESAPIAFKYIAKIGWTIFGDSLLGARLPFVILGTCIIFLVYCMTRSALGVPVALLASLLLAISQYDIGITRVANINPPQIFFFMLSLHVFYKAIMTSNKKLLLWSGVIIGAGFWVKESVIFSIPIFLIYLGCSSKFRFWLKEKVLWISFIIAFCILLPLLILNFDPAVPRYSHVQSEAAIGFSMNAVGFYFGELILLFLKPFPDLYQTAVLSLDMEYPIVNFVLGFVIVTAVITSIKNKHPFIRLMVICFLFNVIIFSFLRRGDVVNSFLSIGSLDWSILGFIPGIILTANMFVDLHKRHKFSGQALLGALLMIMVFRAGDLVAYPLPGYFPAREYFLQNQLNWAKVVQDGQFESDIYFPPGGPMGLAEDTLKKIYSVSDQYPFLKSEAAERLSRMHEEDGN